MRPSDFSYTLPSDLIAQEPVPQRSASRLMVLGCPSGSIEHRMFYELPQYLEKGDCLVLNDTRVIPARLMGVREDTGGKIEFILLNNIEGDLWEVMLKPGRKARPGARFIFGNGVLKAEIISIGEGGNRLAKFEYKGIFRELLDEIGLIPLPPYIVKSIEDTERYQTIYSKHRGSAAAPTAGLHFTGELLDRLTDKGIIVAYLTLHVGLGTFRPVKTEDIKEHKMHAERYVLTEETSKIINDAKMKGGRVVAVGTTSCRVLETLSLKNGYVAAGEGWTDIFICPGYRFKAVDMLLTNFHLPESTLIMLVSAFAGKENVMRAYQTAVDMRYRFFSFGDAMFIV